MIHFPSSTHAPLRLSFCRSDIKHNGGRRDTSQFGVLDDFTKLNLSELSPLAIAGS
jgi:hypothetical protein